MNGYAQETINLDFFNIMFTIVPIFIFIIFVFTIAMLVSPKFRAKVMGRNIKAARYLVEDHEDDLRTISDKTASYSEKGIETTARAIKRGLSSQTKFCKHCGTAIEEDSKYCKFCGKEQ